MDRPPRSSERLIRVVLAELTPVVTAIVKDAIAETGIRIVAEAGDWRKLPEVVAREHANVVIVPTERSGLAKHYHELLQRNPEVKVLTIAAISNSADLYELCFLGRNIGRRGVVDAIRTIVGREGPAVAGPRGV